MPEGPRLLDGQNAGRSAPQLSDLLIRLGYRQRAEIRVPSYGTAV
ncbi:MAG: hypothetical protein ACP5HD_03215 [Thermoproteus sp.]